MGNIVMVKNPDLLRGNITRILEEKLPIQKITCYSEKDSDLLYYSTELPDILIIDLDTKINHIELINYYLEKDVKIVVWTSKIDKTYLIDYFKLGLHGYFYNEMEIQELIYAIHSTINGHYYTHPHLSHIIIKAYSKLVNKKGIQPEGLLTKREWEVLGLIVEGNRNGCIAEQLYISEDTVTNHVASILRKLNVRDRTNAALLAVKNSWFRI